MRAHTESPKVARRQAPVTYETTLTVERAMVRAGLSGTEGAAYQKLRELREFLPRLVDCFHVADSPERLVWFLAPTDAAVDRQPIPLCLDDVAIQEQQVDGDEDTQWEIYRGDPTDEKWAHYKRIVHRNIARLTLKLRAGDAKHGRSA